MSLGISKSSKSIPAWCVPLIGYLVSIGSLIWLIQGVDLDSIVQDFQALHWRWVLLGVASDILVYIFQAWRWNLLLNPVVRVPLWRSVQAIYVGLFANEVLPLRPGELIRSYLQARWSEIPFSVALSSAIIERIFDGIWIVVVFFTTAHFVRLPRMMVDMGKVLGAGVVVLALAMGLIMFWKHHAHRAVPKTRWGAKLRVLIEDLHLMGNSRSFYLAAAASLPYLLMQVVPIYSLMRGYDLELTIGPALVVLVIWRVGTVLPQAPGNIGASQALMALGLGLFGVDKTTAAGLSMMTWGVITLPLLAAGFIALAVTGLNLGELRHHARSHIAAPVVVRESRSQEG